jgi:hypothetical protein
MDKQEYIAEATELITVLDALEDGQRTPKIPSWLKIDNRLQWYFNWKTVSFAKKEGWTWETERINIGGPMT